MALHELSVGKSDEWYTPPRVFNAMGVWFDLDVAHPETEANCSVPASAFFHARGLDLPWQGFVWMNPPFGGRNGIVPWLDKFFAHGNGVALTPDRTSCPWWQTYAAKADLVLFVGGKIRFIPGPGSVESAPAQGTTLMAVGEKGVQALRDAAKAGLGIAFGRATP